MKDVSMTSDDHVASVISTGAAGTAFEHQVGASFLCLVLTGTYVPIFPNSIALKIHFQAKRLGWNVDDFVVEAIAGGTTRHTIAVQVKRTFTLSESNEECCKTLLAAWKDFHNKDKFNPAHDALALVTYLGTNRLLGDFGWLLTQVRASGSPQDFEQRRAGAGLLNMRSKADYETIKVVLTRETGATVSDADLWAFLRVFYVLSYDLTSAGAKDESWVRTLLAAQAIEGDPTAAASTTWAELIKLTADAAGSGASYERSDLPAAILARHKPIGSTEHRSIGAIRDHSEVILNRVDDASTHGLSFSRDVLATELSSATSSNRAVLIVGSAGSGKSVLAKRLVRSLSKNDLVIVFAAEELRAPHIDNVLASANVGVNWSTLRSLFCMQPSKIILLEGLERLLETEERSALIDLLHTVAVDPTVRLIITCRDYHAETAERVILRPSGLSFHRVVVPDLTDAELAEAEKAVPALKKPLSSTSLRRLLRNPFALARAADVQWPLSTSLPSTERALRERLWADIVRHDDRPRDGMPGRRAQMLTNIALLRARSLRPYVEVPSTDPQAIHSLATDNLLAFDSLSQQRAAPAHDVFEDWALVEWLTGEFQRFDGDAVGFAQARDAHPALRRAYRKWLHELIETDSAAATTYLSSVASAPAIPEYLRDDTLMAVFQSSSAAVFLDAFAPALLQNDGELLRKAIHLVRIACKTVSPLVDSSTPSAHQALIPSGSAWANILDLLRSSWTSLSPTSYPLIISFLEDWASGISWMTPYPDGHESAGALLQTLLPSAREGWRDNSEKHRVLALISKIPKSAESVVKDLVERRKRLTRRREDVDAEVFGDLLQKPFSAFAVARDYPQETIELCLSIWRPKRAKDEDDFYSGLREVDSVFGIADHLPYKFFPASALQGPFKTLLQTHPRVAVPFIVTLINDAADHYGTGRSRLQYVEEPQKIELQMPDGTSRTLWGNPRLWNAYRATSVVPSLLESALMALEAWLLDMIQTPVVENAVHKWLVWILRHSNNVAPVAVVASVCLAHPGKTMEANVILLGCRAFFALDRQRMVVDHGALAPGGMGYLNQLLQKERLASNKLPHRRHDLERLAIDAQIIDRDRIWVVLDAHHAALPPLDDQDDEDRLWRLALARMDLRKYENAGTTSDGYVQIQMRKPEKDIQALIDRGAPEQEKYNHSMSLFLWATNQYERNSNAAQTKGEWRNRLEQAKKEHLEPVTRESRFGMPDGGPGIAAAVCIRDHWDELNDDDRSWCVDTVLTYLTRGPSAGDFHEFVAKNPMNGAPACANVMPLICLRLGLEPSISNGLIAALLHFNEDARFEAAKGVSEFLVEKEPRLAAYCCWIMVTGASLFKTLEDAEKKKDYDKRKPFMARLIEVALQVDGIASNSWYESYPDFGKLGFGSWSERHLAHALIHLFLRHPDTREAFSFFSRLATALKVWWGIDSRRNSDTEQRDFELEHAAEDALAEFLLNCRIESALELAQPLLSVADKMPDKLAGLLRSMLTHEDGRTSSSTYWDLWVEAAKRVQAASWLHRIDQEHATGQALIRECFLNTRWREGIQVWNRLGANFKKIDALFESLPASPFVLECYTHYLYHIGRDSLPRAFVLIATKFGGELASAIASDSNIRWHLDALVGRTMFDNLALIKRDNALRTAFLAVLDGLVQAGSSAAFQLRDDFVTPIGIS